MNTEYKNWAPIYDANRREVKPATMDDLTDVGVPFSAYGIAAGDVIEIKKDAKVMVQAPRREGQNPSYLVACTRNGVKSWFNPTCLLRTDRNMEPLYPAWTALGSARGVVEAIMRKPLTVSKDETFSKSMTQFNRDGSFKEEPMRDDAGNVVLNNEGVPTMVRVYKDTDFPVVADPAR